VLSYYQTEKLVSVSIGPPSKQYFMFVYLAGLW